MPSFTIERTLGVSGAVELVLDRVDDKHAFFDHQKSPMMRARGIFFQDSLTQGELGERQALLPQKDRLKREGLKPWFMRSVLHWINVEGRRCFQSASGVQAQSRGSQQGARGGNTAL